MLGFFGFWLHAENLPSLKNQNFEKYFWIFFGIFKKKNRKIDIIFFLHILSIGAFYMSLYLSETVFKSKIGWNWPSQNHQKRAKIAKSPKILKFQLRIDRRQTINILLRHAGLLWSLVTCWTHTYHLWKIEISKIFFFGFFLYIK